MSDPTINAKFSQIPTVPVPSPRSRPRLGHPPYFGHHSCCCLLVSQVHDKARGWRCCGGSPRGRGRDQGLTLIFVELQFCRNLGVWEGQILYRDPQRLPGSLTSACFSQYGFEDGIWFGRRKLQNLDTLVNLETCSVLWRHQGFFWDCHYGSSSEGSKYGQRFSEAEGYPQADEPLPLSQLHKRRIV